MREIKGDAVLIGESEQSPYDVAQCSTPHLSTDETASNLGWMNVVFVVHNICQQWINRVRWCDHIAGRTRDRLQRPGFR